MEAWFRIGPKDPVRKGALTEKGKKMKRRFVAVLSGVCAALGVQDGNSSNRKSVSVNIQYEENGAYLRQTGECIVGRREDFRTFENSVKRVVVGQFGEGTKVKKILHKTKSGNLVPFDPKGGKPMDYSNGSALNVVVAIQTAAKSNPNTDDREGNE